MTPYILLFFAVVYIVALLWLLGGARRRIKLLSAQVDEFRDRNAGLHTMLDAAHNEQIKALAADGPIPLGRRAYRDRPKPPVKLSEIETRPAYWYDPVYDPAKTMPFEEVDIDVSQLGDTEPKCERGLVPAYPPKED